MNAPPSQPRSYPSRQMKSHRSPDIESFQTGPGHHVTKHGVDQRELYHDAQYRASDQLERQNGSDPRAIEGGPARLASVNFRSREDARYAAHQRRTADHEIDDAWNRDGEQERIGPPIFWRRWVCVH
jgi:hypothetical protein